jgi:hypothetical protein
LNSKEKVGGRENERRRVLGPDSDERTFDASDGNIKFEISKEVSMSLVKTRRMTPAALAARRANAQRSHGASTLEGKNRAQAHRLRHGFYSRTAPEALRTLSEYPTEFASLIATLDKDSRAKIWNFAYYLLRRKQQL